MRVFGRVLKVVLRSEEARREITFESKESNLKIVVSGAKYLSGQQDEFTVDIYNLDYVVITSLIAQKYTSIQVFAGYQENVFRVFSGQVIYIANSLENRSTRVCRLICINNLSGLYQNKLNLTLKSGINMYSALEYIMMRAGINNASLSPRFREEVIPEIVNAVGSPANVLDTISKQQGISISGDSSDSSSVVTLWDRLGSEKIYKLTPQNGGIINGYPTLTKNGLTLTALPVANFKPGDCIVIDNKFIDMSIDNVDQAVSENVGFYLDPEGRYKITQLVYNLSTTDQNFTVKITAKTMNYFENLVK